jgi:hypothetical protein
VRSSPHATRGQPPTRQIGTGEIVMDTMTDPPAPPHILVVTDDGAVAGKALEIAVHIARDRRAALDVLAIEPARRADAERSAARARLRGVPAYSHTAHGDVATCIEQAATRLSADLVIVGCGPGPQHVPDLPPWSMFE